MSFTVKISQSKETTVPEEEWVLLADTGGKDGGALYGYAPERQVTSTESVDLFEQTVEELDLIAVIQAVNGLARGKRSHHGKRKE